MRRTGQQPLRQRDTGTSSLFSSVVRAGVTGEAVGKFVELAAQSLLRLGEADRAGVWLKTDNAPSVLEGAVVEANAKQVPVEWRILDLAVPSVAVLLESNDPVAVDCQEVPRDLMNGPLVGLERAVWIPLRLCHEVRGLALLGYTHGQHVVELQAVHALTDVLALVAAALRGERRHDAADEQQSTFPAHFESGSEAIGGKGERAESELLAVLDSVDSGVLLLDIGGRIRFTNAGLAQLFSLDVRRLSELADFESLVEAVQDRFRDPEVTAQRWRELYLGGDEAAWDELELVRPTRRLLERFVRPVFDAEGQRISWLEVYRDITNQRLIQSKLLQTEKMAAVGQLVSGIAHELNNPLTSIMGYAQLLLGRLGPAHLADAQKIFQEAERARRIVKNLLVFARGSKPERKPVDLNEIVERTLALRSYELKLENIAVALDLDPELPRTMADALQLQQVLLNLVVNAEQAILQGRGQGHIWLHTRCIAGNRLAFEVADDGPGIPSEIVSRIFDPFFTTKPPGVGTGLGLSIVYGIVHENGGEIYVDSRPDHGARFVVELPIVAPSAEEPVPEVPERARVPTGGLGRRILVVEDEPTVAQLIADVLREERHQVDVVLDSQEGLNRVSRQSYDLVVCDFKMPLFDGQAFYRALVRAGSPAQHRIIFTTGDTLSRRTLEFLEKNQLPYLAKPFLVEELKLAVNRLLESSSSEPRRAERSRSPTESPPQPAPVREE